jgi:hypothetical protein
VIHGASALAVHAHSGCVATVTALVPPPLSMAPPAGASVTPHFTGVGPVAMDELDPQPAVNASAAVSAMTSGK